MRILFRINLQQFLTVLALIPAFVITGLFLSGAKKGENPPGSSCDILIVGGGIGGVAAAIQACRMADEWGVKHIVMTEETSWLGGQYTSQGRDRFRRQFPCRAGAVLRRGLGIILLLP